MDNCTYNKVKLLNKLANLSVFIERYGMKDAKAAKHNTCIKTIEELQRDLHKHMQSLQKAMASQ